jgi:hypothetical protein
MSSAVLLDLALTVAVALWGSHASEGFVVHHIEIEKMPNLVGRERKRWFAFEGPGRLRLRIDRSQLSQPVVDDELIWERVPH